MAAAGFVSGNVPEGKLQDAVDQLNHLNGIIESIDKTDLICKFFSLYHLKDL